MQQKHDINYYSYFRINLSLWTGQRPFLGKLYSTRKLFKLAGQQGIGLKRDACK